MSELAHHYSHSRNTGKAIQYSRLAGERAVQLSANAEAISHLTTALRLLETLPDTPERAQLELSLQVSLGAPLMAIKGWAAPEVGKAYARARELCRKVGEAPELFTVLLGLWTFYVVRAEHPWKKNEEALALARAVAHPFSLAYALFHAAWVRNFRREWPLAEERAEAMIALLTEQGFAYYLPFGTIFRGWAQADRGRLEAGIAQMRHGLAPMPGAGELFRPCFLSQLAAACGKFGQPDDGLALVAEALATAERSGERHWEAEIYRLKGELLLDSKGSSEAETCFRHAIDIARRQSAKSLELRAATSLTHLLEKQGKKEEARQIRAEIYGWFTEGFDTADLKDAKALLGTLS